MPTPMSVALTNEFQNTFNLSNQTMEFLDFLTERVSQFGKNFGLAMNKTALAEAFGKTPRTVGRYIRELEDKSIISTSVKPGATGGIVIMFTEDKLDFEPQGEPVTPENKTADEVRDLLYPKKPVKKPKKSYRPKAIIAEERLRRQMRNDKTDEQNAMLMSMEYPNKAFWETTEEPELYYQAYLISRMYNFYAVYYPEMRMNKKEAVGDLWGFKLAETYRDTYRDFDILRKGFMGTATFTNFVNLAKFCINNNVAPADYLTVQFDYMEYLHSVKAKNVYLPFANALVSPKSVQRWIDTYQYKTKFRKDHPYYAVSPTEIKASGESYPIMIELIRAFKEPFVETPKAYQGQIDVNVDTFMSKMLKVSWAYSQDIKTAINESNALNVYEKEQLVKFITQETATHMVHNQITTLSTYSSMPQIASMRKQVMSTNGNWREYYHNVGNTGLEYFDNPLDRATNVKRGYHMDFALFGAYSFLDTMKMLKENRGFNVDYDTVAIAIEKFGARKIPLTQEGFLDVTAIRKKEMTEQEIASELDYATPVLKHEQDMLDMFGELWYDISESAVGESRRDGRMIYKCQ